MLRLQRLLLLAPSLSHVAAFVTPAMHLHLKLAWSSTSWRRFTTSRLPPHASPSPNDETPHYQRKKKKKKIVINPDLANSGVVSSTGILVPQEGGEKARSTGRLGVVSDEDRQRPPPSSRRGRRGRRNSNNKSNRKGNRRRDTDCEVEDSMVPQKDGEKEEGRKQTPGWGGRRRNDRKDLRRNNRRRRETPDPPPIGQPGRGCFRHLIGVGDTVNVVLKKDQRTNILTTGEVQRHLTKSPHHPRGIKVMLADGQVGRVVDLLDEA